MCLYTKQSKWLRAKEDIKCYKKVVYKYSSNEYYTPFQDTRVPKKAISGKRCFRAWGFANFLELATQRVMYAVRDGAIHAYSSEESATESAHFYPFYCDAIFECIIPKGTKYAVGNNNDICAKKIRFIKKII